MKITPIGHASLLTEVKGMRIVSDPWWKGPCFGAQWWIYPPPEVKAATNAPVDYIYISHGHNDHFHPATLKTFGRETKVLVSKHIGLGGAIGVVKTGEKISVEAVAINGRGDYNLIYATRLSYLKSSLTTEYGHEILFVGSGGIFEYVKAKPELTSTAS